MSTAGSIQTGPGDDDDGQVAVGSSTRDTILFIRMKTPPPPPSALRVARCHTGSGGCCLRDATVAKGGMSSSPPNKDARGIRSDQRGARTRMSSCFFKIYLFFNL